MRAVCSRAWLFQSQKGAGLPISAVPLAVPSGSISAVPSGLYAASGSVSQPIGPVSGFVSGLVKAVLSINAAVVWASQQLQLQQQIDLLTPGTWVCTAAAASVAAAVASCRLQLELQFAIKILKKYQIPRADPD